jgi:hypothetical protein
MNTHIRPLIYAQGATTGFLAGVVFMLVLPNSSPPPPSLSLPPTAPSQQEACQQEAPSQQEEQDPYASYRPFLNALRAREEIPGQPWGDDNTSYGPYQISLAYFVDANIASPSLWPLSLADPHLSEQTMFAYWARYCPQALLEHNYEVLARVHNGGPRGAQKASTLRYWEWVQAYMAQK